MFSDVFLAYFCLLSMLKSSSSGANATTRGLPFHKVTDIWTEGCSVIMTRPPKHTGDHRVKLWVQTFTAPIAHLLTTDYLSTICITKQNMSNILLFQQNCHTLFSVLFTLEYTMSRTHIESLHYCSQPLPWLSYQILWPVLSDEYPMPGLRRTACYVASGMVTLEPVLRFEDVLRGCRRSKRNS